MGSAAVFVLLLVSRQPAVVALPLLSVSVTLFLSQTILCLSLSVSSVTALFFLSFFSTYSPLESIVCFSPSPKFCPPSGFLFSFSSPPSHSSSVPSPKFLPPLRSSLSQKNRPPLFSVLSPVFIGSRGRGSPYPVQVQGMVAWELQGMVV